MFVIANRKMRIRDGKGFDCPMVDVMPGVACEFKNLDFLKDEAVQCFESRADAEKAGKPVKAAEKSKTDRKSKMAKESKAERKEEAKQVYPDVFEG